MTTVLKIDAAKHQPKDYTEIYRFLNEKYNGSKDCPAVLLIDDLEKPIICRTKQGDALVLLNRQSPNILYDLKKTVRKFEIELTDHDINIFKDYWCPEVNYGTWYKWILVIADFLKIEIPAVHIVTEMPKGMEQLAGAVCPGDSPYTTDLFIKARNQGVFMLTTALHELRHVWQHTYHHDWFKGYFTFDKNRAEEYTRQKAEVDADAFAYAVLEHNGIKHKFDEEKDKAIIKRKEMIMNDCCLNLLI